MCDKPIGAVSGRGRPLTILMTAQIPSNPAPKALPNLSNSSLVFGFHSSLLSAMAEAAHTELTTTRYRGFVRKDEEWPEDSEQPLGAERTTLGRKDSVWRHPGDDGRQVVHVLKGFCEGCGEYDSARLNRALH